MPYYKNQENKVFWFDEEINRNGFTAIDDDEAKQIVDEQQKQLDDDYQKSLTYQDKRRAAYPSIGDQLDALYQAGVFPPEMAARIAEVKAKFPKE